MVNVFWLGGRGNVGELGYKSLHPAAHRHHSNTPGPVRQFKITSSFLITRSERRERASEHTKNSRRRIWWLTRRSQDLDFFEEKFWNFWMLDGGGELEWGKESEKLCKAKENKQMTKINVFWFDDREHTNTHSESLVSERKVGRHSRSYPESEEKTCQMLGPWNGVLPCSAKKATRIDSFYRPTSTTTNFCCFISFVNITFLWPCTLALRALT